MRGIDISNWQNGFDVARSNVDFFIFKASGGITYRDPSFRGFAEQAKATGKPWGFYHFASDGQRSQDGAAEADFFMEVTKDYWGQALPVLDLEDKGIYDWAKYTVDFVNRIHAAKGVWPVIYTGLEGIASLLGTNVLDNCKVWFAGYPYGYIGHWLDGSDHPRKHYTISDKADIIMWQFTSNVTLQGRNVDANISYIDRDTWNALCGTRRPMERHLVRCNIVAAGTHSRMVLDDRFGYSWEERWGAIPEEWVVELIKFIMMVGDYDCSSSTITAWKKAFIGTPYEHALDGATYTGNMLDVFLASGLFEWKPASFDAQPGDLYLNVSHHVAMCQGNGKLSEFSSSETGGTTGKRGDQTGWESHIANYYSYPWDGILHYNGKADYYIEEEDMPFAFLFQPDELNEIWYFSGSTITRLTHVDQMHAIQDNYRKVVGRDIPCYKLGTKKAPWGARFSQAFENRAARIGKLDDEYKMNGWEL